jgi:hypothetical protein
MVVRAHEILQWQTMTRTVDNIEKNRDALQRLFFRPSSVEVLDTETVELSTLEGDAEIAPFVRKGAASILVSGDRETFATLETPNIRISRTLEPQDLMFNRPAGSGVHVSASEKLSHTARKVAKALARLDDRIVNTIEYMVAQLMRGSISYQVEDQENFTITLPRSASNDTTLTNTNWWNDDQTVPGNVARIHETFDLAKLNISRLGLPVSGVILGEEAYLYGTRVLLERKDPLLDTNIAAIGGSLDFTRQLSEAGLIPVGRYAGIPMWRYPRSVSVNGVDFPLIRPKYAEFFSNAPAAEHTLYYGAMIDMEALQARRHIGRRYAKSWTTKDPGNLKMLVTSRPLPWFRRPDSTMSIKVVSG